MELMEIVTVYSENDINLTSAPCEQNADILIVKTGGTYSSH
jgi:hypothetical protein